MITTKMITTKDIEQELEKEEPTFVGERFIRFMSLEEYYKLIEGQVLVNKMRHHTHAKTISVGFCFFSFEEFDGSIDRKVANFAEFLKGIATMEVAVVFVNRSTPLMVSRGTYFDWENGSIDRTEYCTTTYDRDSMEPLHARFL